MWTSLSAFSEWVAIIRAAAWEGTYEWLPTAVLNILLGYPLTTDELGLFNQWCRIMTSSSDVADGARSVSSADGQAPTPWDTFDRNPQVLCFAIRCINRLAGRRGLFFSRDGHIGSGPARATGGDLICILDGVGAPMVLRAAGAGSGKYTVVGPAFVYGFNNLANFKPGPRHGQWQSVVLV